MLLWLLIAVATTTPSAGLDAPAADPHSTVLAIGLALLPVAGAIIAAKIQSKKNPANGPAPLGADSTTPRLDVTQGILERYFSDLVKRVEITEAKSEDLQRQNSDLQVRCARLEVQLEAVQDDLREERAKNSYLEGQLKGPRPR